MERRATAGGYAARSDGPPVAAHLRAGTHLLVLHPCPDSRYCGWIRYDAAAVPATAYKLLERIEYLKEGVVAEPLRIVASEEAVLWEYADGARIVFRLAAEGRAVRADSSRAVTLRFIADVRPLYEYPAFKRAVTGGGGAFTVEDGLGGSARLAFAHDGAAAYPEGWTEAAYARDATRHSPPDTLWVRPLAEITARTAVLAEGPDAGTLAAAVLDEEVPLLGVGAGETNPARFTEAACARALRELGSPIGLWAGLPWFHQVWSRDELIAALGLPPAAQRETVERYAGYGVLEGELPTFQGSGTTCADGAGWYALLLREYGVDRLDEAGKARAADLLEQVRQGLVLHRMGAHGLIGSGHNATWMDTIGRTGQRVEIQAMYHLVLELLDGLRGTTTHAPSRELLKAAFRRSFFQDGRVKDGAGDPVIRPNLFLAALIAPSLLEPGEWMGAFDVALETLGLPWGGLASLDPDDPRFQPVSTGEDNRSYHNGDSWYFVNCLAATALARLDRARYAAAIEGLARSSRQDVAGGLWLGGPGEIAGADGAAAGCGSQAFSAGAYLFMSRELER